MFLRKMSGVSASDLCAFGTAGRIAKISQNLGSRFVVLGAARIDELLGLKRPFFGRLGRPVMSSAISILPSRLSVGGSFIVKGLLLLLLSLIESDDFFSQVFGIV
jgi:hypothetical protein